MKKFSSKKILFILVGIMALLLVLHTIFINLIHTDNQDYWQLVQLFDMDAESSLFTWYSSVILLFVPSLLVLYVWLLKHQAKEKYNSGWLIAGLTLLYLSIDDVATIHEKFSLINSLTGFQGLLNHISSTWLAWSWWVAYIPLAILVGVLLWRWFWNLPKRTKIIIVIAIAVAALGQVGMEAVSSYVTNSTGHYVGLVWRGYQKFVGRLGLSIFLYAIIDYIMASPEIRARFAALIAPIKVKKK